MKQMRGERTGRQGTNELQPLSVLLGIRENLMHPGARAPPHSTEKDFMKQLLKSHLFLGNFKIGD